jgi:intracellular sulfur oxidation DsrE/DsrF family protein
MAAGIGAMTAPVRAQAAGAPWQPAREDHDAWLDKPGSRHRIVFDTASIKSVGAALASADTFYMTNKTGYNLGPDVLGVVIVLRHFATPAGYGDAIWAKYGAILVDKLDMTGTTALHAAKRNPWLAPAADPAPDKQPKPGGDDDTTLTSLAKDGTRFAICGLATMHLARQIAKESGGDAAKVEAELKASLIPGAVLAASGILAVNRAQERGYTFMPVPE